MASHNSFDNQAAALLDRHPQSPPPPTPSAVSSPSFIVTSSSPLVFAQPALPLNLRRPPTEEHQTPPPIPPHQSTPTASAMTTIGAVFRSTAAAAASGCILIDGQQQSVEDIQKLVSQLREEIAIRDAQIARLTGEIANLRRMVGDRDRDVDQLKSVLDQKFAPLDRPSQGSLSNKIPHGNSALSISAFDEVMELGEGGSLQSSMMPSSHSSVQGPPARVKKQGVRGESVSRNANVGFIHYEKGRKSV
ncbi:hypothetical protein Aperf_G00000130380 [Anoplocephala perfoliata]